MALATAAIAEVAGTYEIPKRWVGSIYTDTMLIPLFVVRCYWHRVELPRSVGQRPNPCPSLLQPTFTDHNPSLSTNDATERGRSYT
jgi:hypothetical protein